MTPNIKFLSRVLSRFSALAMAMFFLSQNIVIANPSKLAPKSAWADSRDDRSGIIVERHDIGGTRHSMPALRANADVIKIISQELEKIRDAGKMWNTILTVEYWVAIFGKAGKPDLVLEAGDILGDVLSAGQEAWDEKGTATAFAEAALNALPSIGTQKPQNFAAPPKISNVSGDSVWDYLRSYYIDIARGEGVLIRGVDEETEKLITDTYGIPEELKRDFFDTHYRLLRRGSFENFKDAGRKLLAEVRKMDPQGLERKIEQIKNTKRKIWEAKTLEEKTGIYLEEVFQKLILCRNLNECNQELMDNAIDVAKYVDEEFYIYMSKIIPALFSPGAEGMVGDLILRLNENFLTRADVGYLFMMPVVYTPKTYENFPIRLTLYKILRQWDSVVEGKPTPAYLVRSKYHELGRPEYGHCVPGQPYVVLFEDLLVTGARNIYISLNLGKNRMFNVTEDAIERGVFTRDQVNRIDQIVLKLFKTSFSDLYLKDPKAVFDIAERVEFAVARHEDEHKRREKIYWGQVVLSKDEEKAAYLSELADSGSVHYILFHLFGHLLSARNIPHKDAARSIIFELANELDLFGDKRNFLIKYLSAWLPIEKPKTVEAFERGDIECYITLFEKLAEIDEKTIMKTAQKIRQKTSKEGFKHIEMKKGTGSKDMYEKAYREILSSDEIILEEKYRINPEIPADIETSL